MKIYPTSVLFDLLKGIGSGDISKEDIVNQFKKKVWTEKLLDDAKNGTIILLEEIANRSITSSVSKDIDKTKDRLIPRKEIIDSLEISDKTFTNWVKEDLKVEKGKRLVHVYESELIKFLRIKYSKYLKRWNRKKPL